MLRVTMSNHPLELSDTWMGKLSPTLAKIQVRPNFFQAVPHKPPDIEWLFIPILYIVGSRGASQLGGTF